MIFFACMITNNIEFCSKDAHPQWICAPNFRTFLLVGNMNSLPELLSSSPHRGWIILHSRQNGGRNGRHNITHRSCSSLHIGFGSPHGSCNSAHSDCNAPQRKCYNIHSVFNNGCSVQRILYRGCSSLHSPFEPTAKDIEKGEDL